MIMINKNILLLGATGSIGTQVLDVIRNNDFCLKSVACGKNIKRLENIINEFSPEYVSVELEEDCLYLKNKYPNINVGFGLNGLIEAATYGEEKSTVINAVVGMKGLIPTVKAIEKGNDILLANKETLVVAGSIIKELIKKHDVSLVPIDSEHNAIKRLLENKNIKSVEKIIITASGGSFLKKSREELENVSISEALIHPNWSMGSKITIDSATMVNKGLEVIEAHYLFDIPYEKIETVIHPESIIHSMVEFVDGSVTALMYNPTMINPISHAIYGEEKECGIKNIDFKNLKSLSFKEMDFERFPMIKLAYEVGNKGGILPLVYNSSNEVAVKLFLDGKIKFLDIEKIIIDNVRKYYNYEIDNELTIEKLIEVDDIVRKNIIDEVR